MNRRDKELIETARDLFPDSENDYQALDSYSNYLLQDAKSIEDKPEYALDYKKITDEYHAVKALMRSKDLTIDISSYKTKEVA